MLNWIKNRLYEMTHKGYTLPDVTGFLNPLCEVEVIGLTNKDGRPDPFKQPFIFMIHTYLKDYGWNPEKHLDNTPYVIFRMAAGSEIKFPLYIKERPKDGFGTKMSAEEVLRKGYIVPSKMLSEKSEIKKQ